MKANENNRLATSDSENVGVEEEEVVEESEGIGQIYREASAINVTGNPAFKAVIDNDIPRLSAIIFTGYDIDSRIEIKDCPDKGAYYYEVRDWNRMVRSVRLKGYAVLHLAVVHSKTKVIEYLVSKGADVNILDANLISPLSLAAAIQRPDVTRLLIKAGSVIDSQSVSGRTPLIQAISNNNLPIVKQLLRAGANPNLADMKGTTPLLMCLQANKDDMANVKILKALIDAGSTVDLPNKQGGTALMLAVSIGRLDAMGILLRAGADISLRDNAGQTMLHLVSGPTTAVYLLHNGATSDCPDKKGFTPLKKAAKVGHISLMCLFLESDCPRNPAVLEFPRVIQAREQVAFFDDWLHKEFDSPRPLRRLCREVVRHCLSPSNTTHITNLPIPQMVKDFLLCKHLDLNYGSKKPQRLSFVPSLHPH